MVVVAVEEAEVEAVVYYVEKFWEKIGRASCRERVSR